MSKPRATQGAPTSYCLAGTNEEGRRVRRFKQNIPNKTASYPTLFTPPALCEFQNGADRGILVEAEKLIHLLYENGCVQLSETPFTWSSGIQAPLYVDHRRLFGAVSARRLFVQAFSERSHAFKPDAAAGVGDAATPWGAWVAEELDIPFLMVRKSGKQHGLRQVVEGSIASLKKVLLVEDVVTTGASTCKAMLHLGETGHQTMAVVTALDYGLRRNSDSLLASLTVESLYDFRQLVEIGSRLGFIEGTACTSLKAWHATMTFGTSGLAQ